MGASTFIRKDGLKNLIVNSRKGWKRMMSEILYSVNFIYTKGAQTAVIQS